MMPAYAETIKECLTKLELALAEAEVELPDEVRNEHFSAARHGPNAWDKVYHAHFRDALLYPDMLTALLALRQMVEARTALRCVIDEIEQRAAPPPNLTLGRARGIPHA